MILVQIYNNYRAIHSNVLIAAGTVRIEPAADES